MGSQAAEIDAWLREGGLVVTASERVARALAEAFHRARQAEGLSAWAAPNIRNWNSFVREAWDPRGRGGGDGRLLLNPAQERALWTEIVGESRQLASVLTGPRHRLAGLAMEAHGLLCSYAPRFLQMEAARSAWEQDAGVFSGWLKAFDDACREKRLLSTSRLPLELIALLGAESAERPALLLAGFDRILPVQQSLLDAWGAWRLAAKGEEASEKSFHAAEETQGELAACAHWCGEQLDANPQARLLVVTQEAGTRRGEMERAFLRATGAVEPLAFEFSLGVPLGQVALAQGACLLLRWLTGPLEEQEVDWLLATGQTAASDQETLALQAYMRALRRRGLERTQWTLEVFVSQWAAPGVLPDSWAERMRRARGRIAAEQRAQSPLDWAGFVPNLLEVAGWLGGRALASAEYQALTRWEQALDETASLGFDGRRMGWSEFLAALSRNVEETLFAPQSRNAPIQIAGPAESAGLTADAIWFLGASEDAWPARGATNPLLPPEVQRDAGMPHATAQLDWELARAITQRLLASAPEVHFSYARQIEGNEARPSRLIADRAGAAASLQQAAPMAEPLTVAFEDFSRVPFPAGKAGGGASVLTNQSQCPFKAFATARLGAQGWEPVQAGLTPAQRGQLLHDVLHSVWGGPPNGIRTQAELQDRLKDLRSFVAGHVARVLGSKMPGGAREHMPRRYLELEGERLADLVSKWLEYEAARWPFEVVNTEVNSDAAIAGLALKLRLDRVDRLNDGSLLVIDYKSGDVSPKVWELPRPEDVQLPLYAGFALDPGEELGGLVFAKVRPGNLAFAGRVGDAKAALLPGLGNMSRLVKDALTAEQPMDWRECIEELARDFVAGRAEVDPRDYPTTCELCGLQALCRIQEREALFDAEDDAGDEEAFDE